VTTRDEDKNSRIIELLQKYQVCIKVALLRHSRARSGG